MFLGTIVAVGVHVAALHLAPTQALLRVEPLDLATWGYMLVVASSVLVAVELHKLLVARRHSGAKRGTADADGLARRSDKEHRAGR